MALITQTQQQYYNSGNYGGYQFTSLNDVIDNFMATYVGTDKILSNVLRTDVSFHAHRAMQELSFDTFKSCKSQEIELPPSLTMILPQDYVNYVKLTWSDSAGIEHVIYPTSKTSHPTNILQNSDGDYALTATGTLTLGSPTVTLDAEYSNILVGMQVSSPSIPAGTLVASTANASSITTITLEDAAGVAVNATWGAGTATNSQEVLTFTPVSGDLLLQEQSSFIVETLDWNTTDPKIAASVAADISDIEVGMLVSHDSFPPGTRVLDVNGIYITTSALATAVPAGGANTGEVTFLSDETTSDTSSNYNNATPSINNTDDYNDDTYWPTMGQRYGLDPQHSQTNGSFFIDCDEGKIHFSSNLSGKTIILKYISDSLGTEAEMQVHKFAEEALYRWIAYGCLIARIGIPEYVINRFRREKFAETRKAKLRLSNIKLEEITQIFRGKSKQIKH